MSLSVPTNPAELPAFRRRARRLVDTVSDLVRHGPHTYAAFQARVDADRPARDNGWDHFVDVCLRQMLARDPLPYNAPDVQAPFAAGTVPFGVHLLNDYSDVYKISGSSRTHSAGGPQWDRRGGRGMRRRVRFRCRRLRASGPCPSRLLGLTTTTNSISIPITYFITPSGSP